MVNSVSFGKQAEFSFANAGISYKLAPKEGEKKKKLE
jgi:hypothetical protein